jgi:hypothetical protein
MKYNKGESIGISMEVICVSKKKISALWRNMVQIVGSAGKSFATRALFTLYMLVIILKFLGWSRQREQ